MDKSKLILPISIIAGCIILGAFYYIVQTQFQKQQLEQAKIEEQNRQQEAQNRLKQEENLAQQQETDKLTAQYRTECINTEKENEQYENNFVQNCTTEECVKNIVNYYSSNNMIGNQFIDLCIKAKQNGAYK